MKLPLGLKLPPLPLGYNFIKSGHVRKGDLVRSEVMVRWEPADGLVGDAVRHGVCVAPFSSWYACRKIREKVAPIVPASVSVTISGRIYTFSIDSRTPFTYAP